MCVCVCVCVWGGGECVPTGIHVCTSVSTSGHSFDGCAHVVHNAAQVLQAHLYTIVSQL